MTYERLRKIQSDERGSSALSELPADFYGSAREMVVEKKAKLAKNFSLSEARELENTLKVLRDIYSLREQKMLLRALAVAGGARDGSALSSEERGSFENIVHVLEKSKGWFDSLLEGEMAEAFEVDKPREANSGIDGHKGKHEKKGESAGGIVRLKMLVPMPEFMGADGKKYGPFEAGAQAELPDGEAKLLLKRNAAEAV